MFRDAQISGIVLPAVVLPSTGLGKSGKKAGPVQVKGREFNSEYISSAPVTHPGEDAEWADGCTSIMFKRKSGLEKEIGNV